MFGKNVNVLWTNSPYDRRRCNYAITLSKLSFFMIAQPYAAIHSHIITKVHQKPPLLPNLTYDVYAHLSMQQFNHNSAAVISTKDYQK